jgi:hypothetical protein
MHTNGLKFMMSTVSPDTFSSSSVEVSGGVQEARTLSAKPPSEEADVRRLLTQISRLLLPGEGQSYGDRHALHAQGVKRAISDPQMWTHVFFVVSAVAAFRGGLMDLFVLLTTTTVLSTFYHYRYEKPGKLAKIEGLFAKALFLYGAVQIFYAPTGLTRLIEIALMAVTIVIFIGTNLVKRLYEPWHCLMHVIPPMWALVVALYHSPLINLPIGGLF